MTARAAALSRSLLAILCGTLAACSSFEARWRAAGNPAAAQGRTRWEGRWTSEKHTTPGGGPDGGRLRAVLTELHVPAGSHLPPGPASGRGRALRADFRAHWSVFAASYRLTLEPVPGSPTEFRGTHELPAVFGGAYRYTARIAGDRFTARYDSSYDSGTFTLRRVPFPRENRPPDSGH